MKSFLNYKKIRRALLAKPRYPAVAGFVVFVLFLIWGLSGHAYSPGQVYHEATKTISEVRTDLTPQQHLAHIATDSASAALFSHSTVVTTVFWVGESANKDNGGIANAASTWDSQWQQHFGGVDDPNHRDGYLPQGFTPKENTFYFALPYSDISGSGSRRSTAKNCPLYASMKDKPYSWCKNGWIAIRCGGKVAYGQWEDAGPYGEDDFAYVFGASPPANKKDVGAGLDVSPALRDYLGIGDVGHCDWGFITGSAVPSGPWKQTTTTTPGDSI